MLYNAPKGINAKKIMFRRRPSKIWVQKAQEKSWGELLKELRWSLLAAATLSIHRSEKFTHFSYLLIWEHYALVYLKTVRRAFMKKGNTVNVLVSIYSIVIVVSIFYRHYSFNLHSLETKHDNVQLFSTSANSFNFEKKKCLGIFVYFCLYDYLFRFH